MNHKFEEERGRFGRSSGNLLDPKKILGEIGLKTGDTLLDAGCEQGHFLISALEIIGNNGRVYAIDISEEAVSVPEEEINKGGIGDIRVLINAHHISKR